MADNKQFTQTPTVPIVGKFQQLVAKNPNNKKFLRIQKLMMIQPPTYIKNS